MPNMTDRERVTKIRAWIVCGVACAGFWAAVAVQVWEWLRW